MKKLASAISFMVLLHIAAGQSEIDSLEKQLASTTQDTARVTILSLLALKYTQANSELAMKFAREGLMLARKIKFRKGEADCLRRSGIVLYQQGRYPEALTVLQEALRISEDIHYLFGIGAGLGHIANINFEQRDYLRARSYYFRYLKIAQTDHNQFEQANALRGIGRLYIEQNQLDSASWAYKQLFTLVPAIENFPLAAAVWRDLGELEAKKGNTIQAMVWFRKSVPLATAQNYYPILNTVYLDIAHFFLEAENRDSCIYYAQLALNAGQKNRYAKGIVDASQLLAQVYETTNEHEAFHYQKLATAYKDSLFNTQRSIQVQNLLFDESQRQQALQAAKMNYRNQLRLYALLSGLGVVLLFAFILYRNNIKTRHSNNLLKIQKEEIEQQRTKAETALHDLKAAQKQLIHSEKMASLGELTAGIAHEIQNPLNFVNNFSDANAELLTEMKLELDSGNLAEAKLIATDVIANEEKINLHGKRAEAIVKNMLQHSRTNSAQKEPTDINKLVDEYLRLSYHGFRTKDKSFNAKLVIHLDEGMGKVNIIPQEIGRALLNLFNNAFYAVHGQLKKLDSNYEPTVSVSTKGSKDKIQISVQDNGIGISKTVANKIFQPFFTTKPTGQGTGLGLSLSYDIIKAHGGELYVESEEGQGAVFTITLPI